jgi:hypothetical protein
MRTLEQLHTDLADVNVQEVARRSGVNPKTIYRIRQSPEYTPGVRKAERISAALDALATPQPEPATSGG